MGRREARSREKGKRRRKRKRKRGGRQENKRQFFSRSGSHGFSEGRKNIWKMCAKIRRFLVASLMAMIIGTMPAYACDDMQENMMMDIVKETSAGYADMGSVNVGGLQKMVLGLENSGAEITGRTPGGSTGVLATVNTSNNKPIFSLNSDDPGAKEAFSISVTFLVITTVMYLIDFLIKKLRDRHD